MVNDSAATEFFFELTPEKILESVEQLGFRCTGRVLALNSMENRVYEVEIEVDDPATLQSRWDGFRVVKFYRPGRWSREQIREEHTFLLQCQEAELPVVPPLKFPDGATIGTVPGLSILYSVFPKVGGRILDEMSEDELRRMGRLIARTHIVGAREPFQHRMKLDCSTYGTSNLEFLQERKLIPSSVEGHYVGLAQRIFSVVAPWFSETKTQRLHGDLHVGNVLWHGTNTYLVDFDDSLTGPCVQDVWLMTPGRDDETRRRREILLEGYSQMKNFDYDSLRLIEPLRALRMVHFCAWIARRYEDPAFKRVFVDFGSERYWREQLIALQEVGETLGIG